MELWPEFLASSGSREFVAGGLGGMAGVIAGYPLDTIRIHLQQPKLGLPATATSALSVIRRINAVGGPLGFFKGMGAPLGSAAVQTAVTFHIYAHFSRALCGESEGPPSYGKVAMAGFGAGLIQTGILTPVELVKIRLQLTSATTQAAIGPFAVAQSILRMEGVRGLYRGLGITMLRDAPAYALYYSSYEYTRELLQPGCKRSQQESLVTLLTAGGVAGVASWICCYPLDVVKSRLQAQGGPGIPTKYRGIADCLTKSVQEEGFRVFLRGLGTAVTRAYIVNGAIFTAYELSLRCILLKDTKAAPDQVLGAQASARSDEN